MNIVPLDDWFTDGRFLELLTLAADRDPREVRDELVDLTTVGVIDDAPIGFISYTSTNPPVIEFIAVAEDRQGEGIGRALVDFVGRPVVAETDDDAVEFYRRLGFEVSDAAPHPLYPGVRRYRCELR